MVCPGDGDRGVVTRPQWQLLFESTFVAPTRVTQRHVRLIFFPALTICNTWLRYVQSRSQVVAEHSVPAKIFLGLSVTFAIAGSGLAAGWLWANRRVQLRINDALEDIDDDDEQGVDHLDPAQDEPVTPSASAAGGGGGSGSLHCIVCFERKRRVVCIPCRHFALCVQCARSTWDANGRCPCCRADLEGFSSVFLA